MLAMQEQQRITPELRHPDQFVSIGTGMCTARQVADTEAHPSFFLGNNSLQQTFNHYWTENFDGDKQFAKTRNMMSIAFPNGADAIDQWLRRFNLPLDGELPDLADAHAIEGLANAARTHFASDPALHDLAHAIYASTFYTELRCMPLYENGHYICYGRILCRIPVTKPVFSAFMRKFDTIGARFLVQKRKARVGKPMTTSFDHTGNFSRPFCFRVRDLDDLLDIRLEFSGTRSYQISASPLPINTFVKLQKLEHRSLLYTGLHNDQCTRKRQSTTSPSPTVKRCRLGEDRERPRQ
jgi:hypothetical protein